MDQSSGNGSGYPVLVPTMPTQIDFSSVGSCRQSCGKEVFMIDSILDQHSSLPYACKQCVLKECSDHLIRGVSPYDIAQCIFIQRTDCSDECPQPEVADIAKLAECGHCRDMCLLLNATTAASATDSSYTL